MAVLKILLPYNLGLGDQKALDFVISTFAHLENLEVTLFYAYTPVPEIKMDNNPVMDKLKSNLTYLSQKIKEQEAGLDDAKQHLTENGFSDNQVNCIFKRRSKDVAKEIADLAMKGHYDLIVLNRKPGKVARFFAGSVFTKVVSSLRDKTVCLIT